MLRRPSTSPSIRREEGCSSTAFDPGSPVTGALWNNPAGRGSAPVTGDPGSAVP
jgi:hypothetical protein